MSLLDDFPKISTPLDLATYLGLSTDEVDLERANFILALAESRCSALVSPLPTSALAVVLDVAQRAYVNATGVTSETTGPFSAQMPGFGVSLTAGNRRELRALGGRGGGFTIDPTPLDAGSRL